jgi:hypothetical protein
MRQSNVLLEAQDREEVEKLEDDTDPIPTEKGQPLVVHLGDIFSINKDLSLVRRVQSPDDIDQGRFSATAFPCYRDKFILGDLQTEMVESHHWAGAQVIDFSHIGEFNEVIVHLNKKSRDQIFPALSILMGGKRYCQPEKEISEKIERSQETGKEFFRALRRQPASSVILGRWRS